MLKFTVHGVEVTANNAAEAADLIRALGRKDSAPAAQPARLIPPRKKIILRSKKNGFDVRSVAVAFLTKIRDAGRSGTSADDLMNLLGARHPKGIGSKAAAVNALIEKHGFDIDAVYDNPRTPEGRIWRSGPKMDEAIQSLTRGG